LNICFLPRYGYISGYEIISDFEGCKSWYFGMDLPRLFEALRAQHTGNSNVAQCVKVTWEGEDNAELFIKKEPNIEAGSWDILK